MFTIRFVTDTYAPGQTVTMRWDPSWGLDRGGIYTDGAWTFYLDENELPGGLTFKFVLTPGHWMAGDNLQLAPAELKGVIDYSEGQVGFARDEALVTEHGVVPQRLMARNLDPNHEYDVLIVGSGMGGGLLASRLADAGADVLVLEAGSYLFPTHIGNLPRHLRIGQFDKHVWSLWPDFKVVNYQNAGGSQFAGGQGFNLGGRSLFWGGLIPRQEAWELAPWPAPVSQYLLGHGYADGESALDCAPPPDSAYQVQARNAVQNAMPGYTATDASVAVQYTGATALSIPGGFFSTADLLLEDFMADDLGPKRARPTINLNFAVWSVLTDPTNPQQVVGVQGWDLLSQKQRTFRAKKVVLAAGTIESAKIALQSQLRDPNGKIGRGITDHTIRYRHFTLPPGSELTSPGDSAKILLRHPQAAAGQHAFDIVVELGSEFNQGRYIDPEHLAQERAERGDWMMCELVFMSYADLNEDNYLTATGVPADPVTVMVNRTLPSAQDLAEADQLAVAFFNKFGAEPVLGENGLGLLDADLGGVAHEVGTLRMAGDGTGVVDADLKFLDYDNLFACDNSVFPTSPAANPSLTLASLTLRLASHLST